MAKTEWFWSKVKIGDPEECWEWQGAKLSGYGRVPLGRRAQYAFAHRMAYQIAVGPIPEGLCVLHSCDNRPCCNPGHLHTGTRGDNIREAVERNRQARGESSGKAKLRSIDILTIQELYATGGVSQQDIGNRIGISRREVSHILRGECWGHLERTER